MKRGWKITLIVSALLVGGCAASLGGIFYATSGLTKTANEFFTLLKMGKQKEAYAMTSSLFRKVTSAERFAVFASSLPFSAYEGAVWNSRKISLFPSTATIEGTVTFQGEAVPASIEFAKESGVWKIQNIDIKAGVSQGQSGLTVPGREEILALVNGTMGNFAQAVSKKDFTDFYGTISTVWKRQTTPEKITAAFKGFMPFGKELQKSVDSGPTLNAKPLINEKQVLVVQGFYPIEATKMLFNLQYVYEAPEWKLLGMDLEVK